MKIRKPEAAPKNQSAGRVPGRPASPSRSGRRVFSMRMIVTWVAVIIITAAMLAANFVAERNTRRSLTAEIEARLMLEAHNLALVGSDALLSDFPELVLHPLIKEMRRNQPELALAVVTDHQNLIQGHVDSRRLGVSFDAPPDLVPVEDAPVPLENVELLRNDEMLVAKAFVTQAEGRTLGAALVGLRRDYIEGIVGAARTEQAKILAVVLCLGVIVTLVIMTVMLRPIGVLRRGLERIGAGDLDTPLRLGHRTEFGMLADTVNTMAAELKSAQAEMVEKERLAHELDLAREIQTALLPTESRRAGGFLIEGAHHAAAEVGGDYFDILDLPGGKIGVAVADVAGKGLAGCMVMSMLSALLRAFRERSDSPSEVLCMLDESLGESLRRGTFVTMFYGILDPAAGTLVHASAGHSPLLIFRHETGRVERRKTRGIPLGAIRGGAIVSTLSDETVDFAVGDMLVQYTDGINETFDRAGEEQFGFDRMSGLLSDLGSGGVAEVVEGFRTTLTEWRGDGPRTDDETLLVVRCEKAAVREAPATAPASNGGTDPLEILARARKQGQKLTLPSTFDNPNPLRSWLSNLCDARMGAREVDVVYSALYEACANVSEHGYGSRTGSVMELWWVCDSVTSDATEGCQTACPPGGRFLIRDQGQPFSADNWRETDFSDRKVWSRGRGFGLDIIHRAMAAVSYHPSTAEGNLTVFEYTFCTPSSTDKEPKRA